MNTFYLRCTAQFLGATKDVDGCDSLQYERAYYPLHALASQGDTIRLLDCGKRIEIITGTPKAQWVTEQSKFGYFEDGSGFCQRYTVE